MSSPGAVVVDNGSHTLRARIARVADEVDGSGEKGDSTHYLPTHTCPNALLSIPEPRRLVPPSVAKSLNNFSGVYYKRPHTKGVLTDPEAMIAVWENMFGSDQMDVDVRGRPLVLMESVCNFPEAADCTTEIVFEHFQFGGYMSRPGALMSLFDVCAENPEKHSSSAHLVLDIGYSGTHAVPIFDNYKIAPAVRRSSVGGCLTTNHMKDALSTRHFNLMEEGALVEHIKHTVCRVSSSFNVDMNPSRLDKLHSCLYALPTYAPNSPQFGGTVSEYSMVSESVQVLKLTHECISVPEVLFTPSDIGIREGGIADTVIESIMACPEEMRAALAQNILVVGGSASLPGLKERLEAEVRAGLPSDLLTRVVVPPSPDTCAFRGATRYAELPYLASFSVTKQHYDEHGAERCRLIFEQ